MQTTNKLEKMKEMWDERGKEKNPVKASHYVIKGGGLIDEEMFDELTEEIASRLELNHTDSLLEVGCGSGLLVKRLKNKADYIVGIDISNNMLSHINDDKIELAVAEANTLPFKTGQFDKVFCHSVFHYFPDIEYAKEVILEMLRVCKPNGKILICDILNGYLKEMYLKEEKRNINFYGKIKNKIIEIIQPIYYIIKHKQKVYTGPLFIEPLFFKKFLENRGYKVYPLFETVENKPKSFLIFRYDVLIYKNVNEARKP